MDDNRAKVHLEHSIQTLLEDLCLSAQQTMDAWVNFKLFGTLGLTLLLIVITVVILSKNIKERESGV